MTDETDTLPPPRKPNDTHDFAGFVRILGRGPGRSRSLTRAEARYALGMVLRGEATREQIGALLMLLRYRGEAIQEATGLVEAARTHAGLPWNLAVDLDWPSYADGRTRGLPWYLLSALLLARNGHRVLMHGPLAGPGRQPLVESLAHLNIAPLGTAAAIAASLAATGFAFAALENFHPGLADLLALRGILGLRSPLNTVGRLLNPADAQAGVDGVFHPAYIELHLGVAAALNRRVTVLKGGGGEAEWAGTKTLAVHTAAGETSWPALPKTAAVTSQSAADMVAVWRGERGDPGGETVVIATAALALHALNPELEQPFNFARAFWNARDAKA